MFPRTASAQGTCDTPWSATAIYPTTQTVFSYDDATSIAAKATYIKSPGLGGGYVWAMKDDDADGTLAKALAAGLNP
jgi:chitinase